MADRRGLIVLALLAVIVAACGSSSPNPTSGPGGGGGTSSTPAGGGGGGNETQGPDDSGSAGSGNQPAGWDRYGKVTYTLSGPASASGELGFVPAGSVFAGTQVTLSFYNQQDGTIVSLRLDGANGFAQFGDGKVTFTSEQCMLKDLRVEAGSASGGFDCTGPAVVESGAVMSGAKFAGTFTARVT